MPLSMEYQLRQYKVKEGELDAFVSEWRSRIYPLRKKFGFDVVGAWASHEESRFVWILGWDGPPGSLKKADEEYAKSPQRTSVEPNPRRHLLEIEEHIMTSALP